MDLKQLTAVVTVADVGSVTRAAELLHLVQPAVTRQIRNLEDELGVALFERTKRGMVLTENGVALVERAKRALGELERARAELQPDGTRLSGIVTVGVLGAVVDLLVEPLVDAIARQYPGIELRLATAYSGHLQQWLDRGDLDVSMIYNMTGSQSIRVRPLLQDRLWAIAPPDAALSPDAPVDLAEVLRQPFVMPIAGKHGLRVLLDQARVNLHVQPNVTVQANSMTLQKLLVSAGRGWSILPAPGVLRDLREGTMTAAPIKNPSIPRTIGLAMSRARRSSPAADAVASVLVDVMRDTVERREWPSADWLTVDS